MTQAPLTPFKLGPIELSNRIVMAPLTPMRSLPGNVTDPLNATYYGQRASMGLFITEVSQVSPEGTGCPGVENSPVIRENQSPENCENFSTAP